METKVLLGIQTEKGTPSTTLKVLPFTDFGVKQYDNKIESKV